MSYEHSVSLRNEAGVSITSIYECGSISKAGQLGKGKEAVEKKVSMCSSLSKVCEDEV